MTDTHPSLTPRPWWPLLLLVIIAAAAILTYANSLTAPFVFDDTHNIVENPHVRMTGLSIDSLIDAATVQTRRPVASITFALNYYFHGYDVTGYHVVNIAIHILAGFLMFLVVRHTLGLMNIERRDMVAGLAALVWLVNPVHTQSVTYIVQRMTALATLFFLLALYLYIKGRLRQRTGRPLGILFFVLCGLSGILAVLSKQIAATLPFFILVYEWYFFQDLDRAWIKKQAKWIGGAVVAIGALAAIYLGASPVEKIMAMYNTQDFTMGQRLLTEPRVIFLYLSLLFFPHPARLNLDYDFPVSVSLIDPFTTLVSILGLIGLVTAAVVTAKKQRLVSFAVVWFLGNLAIESSFIGLALVFEHRTYLPSVFVVAALAWAAITYIRPRRPLAVGLLCALTILWGFWTYQRNAVWADEVTLWRDVINKSPNHARAHYNLGHALDMAGKIDTAIPYYRRAILLDPSDIKPHNNLSAIFLRQNRTDMAIQHALEALRLAPDCAESLTNYGVAMMKTRQTERAIISFEAALQADPMFEKAHNNLGVALFQTGDMSKAIIHFKAALRINPSYTDAGKNLEKAEAARKNRGQEAALKQEAGAVNPEDPVAAFSRGRQHQRDGNLPEAIRWYKTALELNPSFPICLNRLGSLYARTGNEDQAIECFHALARLAPDNAVVYYNLACLYARQHQAAPALANLEKALAAGYGDMDRVRTDKDLDPIRHTEAFDRLIQKSAD